MLALLHSLQSRKSLLSKIPITCVPLEIGIISIQSHIVKYYVFVSATLQISAGVSDIPVGVCESVTVVTSFVTVDKSLSVADVC